MKCQEGINGKSFFVNTRFAAMHDLCASLTCCRVVDGESSLFDIANDSDDGVPRAISRAHMEKAANWISVSEMMPGQRLSRCDNHMYVLAKRR